MASEHELVPDSDREKLLERLAQLPDDMQPRLRLGFRRLASLDPPKRASLVAEILVKLGEGKSPRPSDVADSVGLDASEIGDAIISVLVLGSILLDLEVSAEKFLDISESKLFNEDDRQTVAELATQVVNERSRLKDAVRDASLANAVLPSFSRLQLVVDLRLKFNDGKLERRVPIAVAYIDTDCADQDIWFQLRRSDIREIIARLQQAETEMDLAERALSVPSGG